MRLSVGGQYIIPVWQVLLAVAFVCLNAAVTMFYVRWKTRDANRWREELDKVVAGVEKQDLAYRQWMTDTSHELRTPIAIIRAQIEALQDGVREPNAKTLNVLHKEILALTRLVDDLHDLAKHDLSKLTLSLATIDLSDVLQDVVAAFEERLTEKKISLEYNASDKRWMVRADAVRLKQLFSNLLENSYRYTHRGGVIRIEGTTENGSLFLNIEDSPPGVPSDALDKIFERFYRLESSRSRDYGGAGLGLPICQAIVNAHGGSIRALKSALGGVRMAIQLPLLRELTND